MLTPKNLIVLTLILLFPCSIMAQGVIHGYSTSLHQVLAKLYDDLIPICEDLLDACRIIAALGASFYIGARVWRHIANAEPVEIYPLLRPFAIGLCITLFPLLVKTTNGILYVTVAVTDKMVVKSNQAIDRLLTEREWKLKNHPVEDDEYEESPESSKEKWMQYSDPNSNQESGFSFLNMGSKIMTWVRKAISIVLQLLFEAASLCIDTLRTFQLLILVILGPFVFAIGTFDGFGHLITAWLSRYINVYLWLPIANLYGVIIGRIQENMLRIDNSSIDQYGHGQFGATDAGYLIFLIVAIIGYTTIPSTANHIINVGGGSPITDKATRLARSVV